MATTTQVKPPTVAETSSVTYTRSVELVKTLLYCSVSTLVYMRNIFPSSFFENRRLNPADNVQDYSYKDFLNEPAVSREAALKDGKKSGLTCLEKGKHPSSDIFIEWMERAAFEAIEQKCLKAFQIRIFEDPEQPEKILESWTFTVNYPQESDGRPVLSSLQVRGAANQDLSLSGAREQVRLMMRSISQQANQMPFLPKRRHVGMFFFYNDNTDPNYQPPGFEPCDIEQIQFPDGDIWQPRTERFRAYQDGVHSMRICVTHLDKVVEDQEKDIIPPNMTYTRNQDVTTDIQMLEMPIPNETFRDNQLGDIINAVMPSSATKTQFGVDKQRTGSGTQSDAGRSVSSFLAGAGSESSETASPCLTVQQYESRHDVENDPSPLLEPAAGVERLTIHDVESTTGEEMMPDSQHLSQVTITGPRDEDFNTESQLKKMIQNLNANDRTMGSTQRRDDLFMMLPSGVREDSEVNRRHSNNSSHADNSFDDMTLFSDDGLSHSNVYSNRSVCLSQHYLDILEKRTTKVQQQPLSSGRSTRARRRASQQVNAAYVNCECGTTQDEEHMLECTSCGFRQHYECYGYQSHLDRRVPKVFGCYTCLLEDNEKPLLNDLRTLALERRVVHVIDTQGYGSDGILKKVLGLDNVKLVQHTTNRLKSKGFMTPVAKTGATVGRKAKADWGIVRSGRERDVLKSELFDPTTKIAYIFTIKSLTGGDSLENNYATVARDPLTRSSSIIPGSRLGVVRPLAAVVAPVQSVQKQQKNVLGMANLATAAEQLEDTILPRTPSNRLKRRYDEDDAINEAGSPNVGRAKKRIRNSKVKNYLDVEGFAS